MRDKGSKWIGLLLVLLLGSTAIVRAQDDEGEMGFDEVEEEAPIAAATSWADRVHLSGRFDFNFEADNLGGGEKNERFRTYHRFIFLKADLGERLLLEAEVVDQVYYEIKYRINQRLGLRVGRVWVPFGLSPFHHYYGGVQGDPFSGKLVPNVWAEQGVVLGCEIADGVVSDTYVIRGFSGRPGTVLSLNGGGSEGTLAYGQRLTAHLFGRGLSVAGSVLYNTWGPNGDNRVVLFGGDFSTGYGLLKAPFLRHLRLAGAVARANVEDALLVEGSYNKYGDYIEAQFGAWRPGLTLRMRLGSYVDFDVVDTVNDTHSFNIAAIRREGPLQLIAEYFWNFEEVNEVDNDFLRLHGVVEF